MNEANSQQSDSGGTTRWLFRIAIVVITFAAFASGLSGEFVNWDDDANIVFNEGIRGLDGEHLTWMFTTFHGGHYQPLAWLSLAVDFAVWGLNPFGFHLTNLLLHCLAAALFFDVALKLLLRGFKMSEGGDVKSLLRAAFIAALLFSIHPLRVESVTWVTERRDVLSGVFVMLTVLSYLKFATASRGHGWLIFSWIAFALTLLTKASAVPLPFVLLIADAFPLRRIGVGLRGWSRYLAEKIPYIACSIAASVLAIKAQASAEAWQSVERFDLLSRIATVTYGLCWYPFKFLLPTKLCALYPIPPRTELLGWSFALTVTIMLVACVVFFVLRRSVPALLAAAVAYALLLGPVSGIAQSGEQFVADRYGYLPLLPVAILIAAGLHKIVQHAKTNPSRRTFARLLRGSAGVYIFGLFFLTAFQATVWSDSRTLWSHALRMGIRSHVAYVNAAESMREVGHHLEAYEYYEQAAKLDPTDAKAHNGMGITALRLVRPKIALAHLSEAIKLSPDHPKYRFNIAEVHAGFGQLDEAVGHLQVAVNSTPCFVKAISRLASMQEAAGHFAEAIKTLEDGIQCAVNTPVLKGHLAWLLATSADEAIRDGKRAVELARELCEGTAYNDAMALSTLAVGYAELGDFERALSTQSEAIRLATQQGPKDSIPELRRRHALFADGATYSPPIAKSNELP